MFSIIKEIHIMPTCIDCSYFSKETQNCTLKCDKGGRSYMRNCVYAIFLQELLLCKGNILEVGGGQWNPPRRALRANPECKYHGLDPRWGNDEKLGGYKGTVAHMPFADNYFDRVLAFETMEHWREHADPVVQGLKEINRVLKSNCGVCLTVPIHLHGGKEFIDGNMGRIKGYFNNSTWKDVKFEEWRKEYEPCPPSQVWGGNLEYFKNLSTQKHPSAWTLRINATKAIKA